LRYPLDLLANGSIVRLSFFALSVLGIAAGIVACSSQTDQPGEVHEDARPPNGDEASPSFDASPSQDAASPDTALGEAQTTVEAQVPVEAHAPGEAQARGDSENHVFDSVDKNHLLKLLQDLTGGNPITVNGATFRITNRWAPGAKADFRSYWKQYFVDLGATVNELTFPVAQSLVGESQGHNVEAILPGRSADSVVIIVHYDSVGITGQETANPAADDDGSGLAMQMEAARIFAQSKDRAYTLRFVAADYEEITTLQGDDAYAQYLQGEAQQKGFKILVASDNDQTAWSCWDEALCGPGAPAANTSFQMISCSGDIHAYSYPDLAMGFVDVATKYSPTMKVDTSCDGAGDTDHYSFWKIGVPAYVIDEYSANKNPHFDDTGDDTMQHINLDYFLHISQIQITFQSRLAGIKF